MNYMLTNPAQIAYQIPLFEDEDGKFSLVKYQAFIKNPDNLNNPQTRQVLDYIEMQAKQILPKMIFQKNLSNSVFISDSDVRENWLKENEQRQVEWFFIQNSSIKNYFRNDNEEDLIAYYNEHMEDYRHEEERSLDAVYFELAPTVEDSTDVIERAKLLAQRARSGEDFSELADGYSDDPGNLDRTGNRRGGTLGFFGRGAMVKEFEDVAFSLKPGEISEPFVTRFGCHVVKVDSIIYDKTNKKKVEKVKARHILLKIEPSGETRDNIENNVKAFYESVKSGLDFYLKAQKDSIKIITIPYFTEDSKFISIIGDAHLLVKRSFRAEEGGILPIYKTDSGYYIFKLSNVKEAGISPFEEVRELVQEEVIRKMCTEYIENYCKRTREKLQRHKNLDDAVKAVEDTLISPKIENEIVSRTKFIPGIGRMNPLMARVFALENVGDNTDVVTTDNGKGIAVLLEKIPVDEEMFEEEKGEFRERFENELQNDLMSRYIENLKNNAKIIDNRDIILGYL